jgi:hypothetical protein
MLAQFGLFWRVQSVSSMAYGQNVAKTLNSVPITISIIIQGSA